MKHLLNSLFVMTEEAYLSLENENVIVNMDGRVAGQFPLHTLEQILYFGYKGASPALMGACADAKGGLSFFKPSGRFLAKVCGPKHGNVLLRKEQYRISDSEEQSCQVARNFVVVKIFNARSVLERAKRDHALCIDTDRIMTISKGLIQEARSAKECKSLELLRGIEGTAAKEYFSVFNELILQNKDWFSFSGRIKRPPKDPVNALLSFAYTILANDCASALEGVGLDAYVGFLHRDRPGRVSLALDLMEELRSIYADRFILTLINNRILTPQNFEVQEDGAILLDKEGRKRFFSEWQERKKETITHPYLNEKMPWGLVPHIQALLLSRYIRGDLEAYPAFLWN